MSQDKCICDPILFEGEWRHMARCPLWWKTKSAEKQCPCDNGNKTVSAHKAGCIFNAPTTDTAQEYLRNRLDDPTLIRYAAALGAKDQDAMLARATDTAEKHTHAPEHASQCPECLGATVIHPTDTRDLPRNKPEGIATRAPKEDTSDWLFRFNGKFGTLTVAHMGAYWLREFENIKAFISKEIERTREEGKLKGIKIGNATGAGYKRGVEAGRTGAIAEVKEIAEGMKRPDFNPDGGVAKYSYKQYNTALTDLVAKLTDTKH